MTSPFLEKPLRPLAKVIAAIMENMADTHVVVDMVRGELYLRETDLGQSFESVVRDLLGGQYDSVNIRTAQLEGPVAVLRVSRDAPVENVSDKVADAMLDHLASNPDDCYDEERYLRPRPFLDNVRPDWESALPHGRGRVDREYEHEEFLEKQERR